MEEGNLRESFLTIKGDLAEWGKSVDNNLLTRVFDQNTIKNKIKIEPKSRVKNIDSFIAKALYRRKEYDNPILEIEDKVGTRVVFLLTSELEDAQKQILVFDGWESKLTKDINLINIEEAEKFGYQSIHIIVWLEDRPDITCEIQLRTLLQHAYSEVSHDNVYKGPYKSDTGVIRRLSKSMALMEATDDYFCDIYKMIEESKNADKLFVESLIEEYKLFNANFTLKDLDKSLIEAILQFSNDFEIEFNFSNIKQYVERKRKSLSLSIEENKSYLVKQPAFLLLGYLMEAYSNQIKENLPLPYSTRVEVFRIFGVAF